MIIELRIYTTAVGKLDVYADIYKKFAWDLTNKHLGPCLGYFLSGDGGGPLNQAVHIRAYENAGDRETRRAAMYADPLWKDYQQASRGAGCLVSQQVWLMKPADFSPKIVSHLVDASSVEAGDRK